MTISPKICLGILVCLFVINASAQTNVISKGTNGKLIYSLLQNSINQESSNSFVQIVYKVEQTIYKEVSDTIRLNNTAELKDFMDCLKQTIESVSDSKANAYFEKPTYSLFKFDKGVVGVFVSISNTSGSIIANSTKAEAIDFLNWLKKVELK